MLNHFLTLLRNADGLGPPGTAEGFYSPPGFRALALPGELAAVHRVLFGSDPDRAMLDRRGWEYAQVLAATDLGRHVADLDPRLTYDPARPPDPALFREGLTLDGPDGLSPVGTLPAEGGTGRLDWRWQLDRAGDYLELLPLAPRPGPAVALPLAFDGGLSDAVPIPGSPIGVRLDEADTDGGRWFLGVRLRPDRDPAGVLAGLDALGVAAAEAVFPGPSGGEVPAWRNRWQAESLPPAERLGAFLLAFVARLEGLRRGRDGDGR